MPTLVDLPELAVAPRGDNRLVLGDNLLALEALALSHAGAVRCAYVDPPYNTGNALEHYPDDREHAAWLAMMRARLRVLLPLLAPNGVLVAQTDRTESAYLKVLLDELMGRECYITTVAVRMSGTTGFKIEHTDRRIVKNTEYIHVYSRRLELVEKAFEETRAFDDHYCLLLSPDRRRFGRLVADTEVEACFAALDLRPTNANLPVLYDGSSRFRAFVAAQADRVVRSHTAPGPARQAAARGALWSGEPPGGDDVVQAEYAGSLYHLRRTRSGVDQLIPIALKMQRVDCAGGPDRVALTNILGDWWDGFHRDMGNVEHEGGVAFKASKKPERLLRRVLRMFTEPGDLVLDPFGGSGTTAAVAHKMGRRWITIESGDHGLSHLLPRLRSVAEGADPTGVTAATGWAGGGGFGVCRVEGG